MTFTIEALMRTESNKVDLKHVDSGFDLLGLLFDALDITNDRLTHLEAEADALDELEEALPEEGVTLHLSQEEELKRKLAMYINLYNQQPTRATQESFNKDSISDIRQYVRQSQEGNVNMAAKAWVAFSEWVKKMWRWLCDRFDSSLSGPKDDEGNNDAQVSLNDPSVVLDATKQIGEFTSKLSASIREIVNGSSTTPPDYKGPNSTIEELVQEIKKSKFTGTWGEYKKRVAPLRQSLKNLHRAAGDLSSALDKLEKGMGEKANQPELKAALQHTRTLSTFCLKAEAELLKALISNDQAGLAQAKKATKE